MFKQFCTETCTFNGYVFWLKAWIGFLGPNEIEKLM
jgi:hypothetical protein